MSCYIRKFDDVSGKPKPKDKEATVYLGRYLRIRLTDPGKNSLPYAKCWIVGDKSDVFVCDEKGIVKIPVRNWNQKSIDLEWEPFDANQSGGASSQRWKNTFQIEIKSKDDEGCRKRLTHLGFYGNELSEQVRSYQAFFNRPGTGDLKTIRDELVEWHDGGDRPGLVRQTTPTGTIEICLLGYDLKPMPKANCRRLDKNDQNTIYVADEQGNIKIPIDAGTKTVEIQWGPENTSQRKGVAFFMRQTVHLEVEGADVETAISNMLSNIGFSQGSLADRKNDYERYFATTSSDSVDHIRNTLVAWVDKTDFPETLAV